MSNEELNSMDNMEADEMSDEQFDSWLTLCNDFSDTASRKDDTMQKMLIMTKISQSGLSESIINANKSDIVDVIKQNMDNLIGKQFKIVYTESGNIPNILYKKGKIALVNER